MLFSSFQKSPQRLCSNERRVRIEHEKASSEISQLRSGRHYRVTCPQLLALGNKIHSVSPKCTFHLITIRTDNHEGSLDVQTFELVQDVED